PVAGVGRLRMTGNRVEFGSRLKAHREARSLSIVDVSRTTKIPEHQIDKLEHGRFDDLPADVFVRGFLRSYCRAVGLDVDATFADYGSVAPRRSGPVTLTRPSLAHGSIDGIPPNGAGPAHEAEAAPAKEDAAETSLLAAIQQAGRGISRTSLTLAV